MKLEDIVRRAPPSPWGEHDKIPWNDPAFSRRMLREHLSQAHDAASRRSERIASQVQWLYGRVLNGKPGRVLDLGCGPGLYTSRLAALGCACVGIDFSPASVVYAREDASQSNLDCTYLEADIRSAPFGQGFQLVMLIFGELNVFSHDDARAILSKARAALADDGVLVLEAHTAAAVEKMGRAGRSWQSADSSVFGDRPHVWLDENVWDAARRVAIRRHFVIDSRSGDVSVYGQSVQAYSPEEYRDLLDACSLVPIEVQGSWDAEVDSTDEFALMVAKRRT